jgi:hypothetical protein
MRGTLALAALFAAAGLGGCISTGETPEWFQERSAEQDDSYPSLRDVPTGTTANTDQQHWARVETELVAVGAAVKAHPRSQPAPADLDPAGFIEEAREALEETRASHEPY